MHFDDWKSCLVLLLLPCPGTAPLWPRGGHMWQSVYAGASPSWLDWFRWLDGITSARRPTSAFQAPLFANSPQSCGWTTWCTSTSSAGWWYRCPSWSLFMWSSFGWSGNSLTAAPKILVIEKGTIARSWSWPIHWPWWFFSLPCVGCPYTSWTASPTSVQSVTSQSWPCILAFSCPMWTQHSIPWFMHSG